jgi:hypothetical protein
MESQTYEMVKYFPLTKIDEQTHTIYGIVTCEIPDKEGERCLYEGAKKSYQKWSLEAEESTSAAGQGVSLGNIRYMHKLIVAGKATKLKYDDNKKQIWLETTPAPPMTAEDVDVWPLLRGGFLRAYSHGGRYISRTCSECKKSIQGSFCENCGKKVVVDYVPEIAEVSYVDSPALKEAVFTYVKSDGSTELKKFSETPLSEKIQLNNLDRDLEKLVQRVSNRREEL